MKISPEHLQEDGYLTINNLLSVAEVETIRENCHKFLLKGAGSRNLLDEVWCQDLAQSLKQNETIRPLLTNETVAVQCTLFVKNEETNWLVASHRDQFIPVKEKFENANWSGWSIKEGAHFVKPPQTVLEQMVAVRIHLEENTLDNGPLEVVPGSHKSTKPSDIRVPCLTSSGGAIVLRPLLLHASTKIKTGSRTVLHFLFGPKHLPEPAEWNLAV